MGRESQTCRVCTKKSKDFVKLKTIFPRKPQLTYLEVYNICTQLNAIIDDELPKSLCCFCRNELKSAYRFMQKAKETDTRLRENLFKIHQNTRRNRKIGFEEDNSNKLTSTTTLPEPTGSDDAEPNFEEVKPEFINCTKDPLEDSDLEANEKSEDEMDWVPDDANDLETDGFAEEKTATIEDDDDDDKPLKLLIEKEKLKPVSEAPAKERTDNKKDYDSSDVFNDLPGLEDNYSSEDEDDVFKDKMVEVVPDPPTTQEAQIFPHGRYMCKVCKKTYFTAEGLKAHMTVHMPKKKKVKRIRGPNKKKSKSKKKKNNASDDEDEEEDDGAPDKDDSNGGNEKKDVEKNDTTTQIGDESLNAEPEETKGKKKRKNKPPKPKKLFPCSVCGKHMISASKLRYHMVMHTGEKDFLCTMCPKAYSTIYALKHHMRTHTGERPYECKFCGDKFTRPTTLKSHMRRHTGERPYGCDICGKRFIQHSSMTTHMKLNHMAKNIECPHCDKKYARQTDLNTHILSHTGDKPFSCALCPSRFIRQANLNKHMNQHHFSKNKKSKNNSTEQKLESKTDETVKESTEQSMAQNSNNSHSLEQINQFVERNNDNRISGPTTIQFAGQSMHSSLHQQSEQKINESSTEMTNQFAGQVMQQKQTGLTPTANKFASHVMQQKFITTNQFSNVQQPNLSPLPKLVSVRSLARPPQKGQPPPPPPPPPTERRGQEASTPPGSDESNSSNRFVPHSHLISPTALSQLRLQQVQQNNMLPPSTQQSSTNNENSMPMSMNIAGIPGGIPTHSMMGGGGGIHIGQHGHMGSVEHLKGIHPPVDNLTNLLGQVIDPERIGRSVDDMIPWNWSNAS